MTYNELAELFKRESGDAQVCFGVISQNQILFGNNDTKKDIISFRNDEPIKWVKEAQEDPVSEDLEEAAKKHAKCQREDDLECGYDLTKLESFIAGAKWKEEQFEKNRLEHCNSISKEQYELEQGFVDQHLDKYNRMPTFLDAIEYGIAKEKENIKKSPYLCGYVARDKNGLLHVFEIEPRRSEDYWWDIDFGSVLIAHDAFPDLKWEDEPIYVRLLIVKSE